MKMYVGELLKNLDRIPSGVPGLDDLIGGGFLPGRVYLVSGPPGSGKTTLGMQFLAEGAKNDEKGLFIALFETPDLIVRDMLRYNLGILEYVNSKKIVFYDLGEILLSANRELSWDELFKLLLEIIKREGAQRVVIDSFSLFESFVTNPEGKRKELGRFVRKLRTMDITTLLLSEMLSSEKYTDEYYLADGVIVLHHFMRNYQMVRAIQILKMRGVPHDSNLKRMRFTNEGITVYKEAPI
ncbi:RAD55 family ATPase [Thermococcus peptonophilus]